MPLMGCLLAAELLIHIKTRFKKTVIKPFKKNRHKKRGQRPLPDRLLQMNLFTEPHPTLLEWQGWLAQ